jgi:hypothetical protein
VVFSKLGPAVNEIVDPGMIENARVMNVLCVDLSKNEEFKESDL